IGAGPPHESKSPKQIRSLVDRAVQQDPTYRPPNLLAYFAVTIPAALDPEPVAMALSRWETVEVAYVQPGPVPPPVVNPADDPRAGNQGYLDQAPDGIDARYAWGVSGGDGAGVGVVDMEGGWTFNHEDLAAQRVT